jgi:ankyrin repeat protein
MIELGAELDLVAAAGLGRMPPLRAAFDDAGRLRACPTRRGRTMSERDAIGLALLFAYVRGERDAVDFLFEKDGNWNVTGVNNGTVLHRAAWDGDLPMVQRLVARGANMSNRDNPFHATPLSWAQHNVQTAVVEWMRSHCQIDLHDAVCFDLREHVVALVRANPASVNVQIDQWDIPQSAPLHWAAWPYYEDVTGRHAHDPSAREQLVTFLLEHGADPNLVAGNGCTPLDIALVGGAEGIASLLERHGGTRAADR